MVLIIALISKISMDLLPSKPAQDGSVFVLRMLKKIGLLSL